MSVRLFTKCIHIVVCQRSLIYSWQLKIQQPWNLRTAQFFKVTDFLKAFAVYIKQKWKIKHYVKSKLKFLVLPLFLRSTMHNVCVFYHFFRCWTLTGAIPKQIYDDYMRSACQLLQAGLNTWFCSTVSSECQQCLQETMACQCCKFQRRFDCHARKLIPEYQLLDFLLSTVYNIICKLAWIIGIFLHSF